jgi:hypothetical protein
VLAKAKFLVHKMACSVSYSVSYVCNGLYRTDPVVRVPPLVPAVSRDSQMSIDSVDICE